MVCDIPTNVWVVIFILILIIFIRNNLDNIALFLMLIMGGLMILNSKKEGFGQDPRLEPYPEPISRRHQLAIAEDSRDPTSDLSMRRLDVENKYNNNAGIEALNNINDHIQSERKKFGYERVNEKDKQLQDKIQQSHYAKFLHIIRPLDRKLVEKELFDAENLKWYGTYDYDYDDTI